LLLTKNVILASSSRFRAALLAQAGIIVSRETPNIDERALEARAVAHSPAELALLLAQAKAEEVSRRFKQALVIGCDQILVCENHILHKVKNLADARARLRFLASKTHQLHSAIAVYEGGVKRWQHGEVSHLTMRPLTENFIEAYLRQNGEDILAVPGLYQIEGLGIQLFEKIEGDWHAIIGLPLIPLLNCLRKLKVLNA